MKFLYAGIGGSAAVLTASLFAYYQPELSKQMADSALQSAKHLAETGSFFRKRQRQYRAETTHGRRSRFRFWGRFQGWGKL